MTLADVGERLVMVTDMGGPGNVSKRKKTRNFSVNYSYIDCFLFHFFTNI